MKSASMTAGGNSFLRRLVNSRFFTFGITVSLFLILYLFGVFSYRGFYKPQVFYNLIVDYAPTIILTIGVTFVLLTGEIDLSGGSVIAFNCMLMAKLLRDTGLPLLVVLLICVVVATVFGLFQGFLITHFKMQSFIITLAGQFVMRGATAMISVDTIDITNPAYVKASALQVPFIGGYLSVGSVLALIFLAIGTYVLHKTRLGRKMYAVGGDRQSAQLMGIRNDRTILQAFGISGFCAGFASICYSLIMLSGYTLHAIGMEMEAIASSVIGGTMLTGGVAFLPGTTFGVAIQGVIQTIITFQGTLSAWWTKIVIALLLCLSIVAQTLLARSKERNK